ncbi:4-hydroxythreonine-4-phosphate dehydrogenase PdxA [Pelagibius sp. 7325]|uniref:4-hydroxythreonine-4-phosphate dehydrogenase PdxA n=1 Tax=Pelagibius sp. 7325 TaxID=3131994 RepID=UPI0030EBCE77
MAAPAPLALTMGEPAGIGGELTLKAWQRLHSDAAAAFFVIDDPRRLTALAKRLNLDVPVIEIAGPEATAGAFCAGLPVLALEQAVAGEPGRLDPAHAEAVLASIRHAVALAQSGAAAGVVTNPIHKQVLMEAGFKHPGHTEYLAELCRSARAPVMMLACPELRVVPVTVHMPLTRVPEALTTAMIVETGRTTAEALRHHFGIARPRLAVAGLNPHAGEGGQLGREDDAVIRPAVQKLQADGIEAFGPLPADTMFHAAARRGYDVALCMYHDQALIPIKTIDFEGGVNVTLGLPIIRSSPDHGTALDIAGTGKASPASLLAALRMAAEMAAAGRQTAAS